MHHESEDEETLVTDSESKTENDVDGQTQKRMFVACGACILVVGVVFGLRFVASSKTDSLCGEYAGSNMLAEFQTYCKADDTTIRSVTGGDYTVDFCKKVRQISSDSDFTKFSKHMLGPCKDPWENHGHGIGCSRGSHRCLFGDYCVNSAVLGHGYAHNICCGQTNKGPHQCYAAVSWDGFDADLKCSNWKRGLDVCPYPSADGTIRPCGWPLEALAQTGSDGGMTGATARRLMPGSPAFYELCNTKTGDMEAFYFPCDQGDMRVGFGRNWFCNRGDQATQRTDPYKMSSGHQPIISEKQLNTDAPVWHVSAPPVYNTSDPENFQALAINPKTAYTCEPCSTFHNQTFAGIIFNAKSPEFLGKWCSIHGDPVLQELKPYAGCAYYNVLGKLDCKDDDAFHCCAPCPEDDPYVGKLGWMCKKGTAHPCVNRHALSVTNAYARKLMSDNVTVLYPYVGTVIGHKPCSDMAWCKAISITATVISIVLPIGWTVLAETGFIDMIKAAIKKLSKEEVADAYAAGIPAGTASGPDIVGEVYKLKKISDCTPELVAQIKEAERAERLMAFEALGDNAGDATHPFSRSVYKPDFEALGRMVYGEECFGKSLTCVRQIMPNYKITIDLSMTALRTVINVMEACGNLAFCPK